ncbi:MAG: hypothetical protein IAI50_02435 [Candidatus Eremiobacteraeota bacterium]|nr:hypothetical protein [Candidatus Eremiobacteraeota bacterium]
MTDQRIAIVTPSFARDFTICRQLNESVLRFLPAPTKHYIVVDGRDLALFRQLENERTVVAAVEDVIPRGYYKLPYSKKWWFSTSAMVPAKGWLVQQLVKLSLARFADEPILVNVDSDVRFVRPVDPAIFVRNGRTRMYRLPGGVVAGMEHVKWHHNLCRLMDVSPDPLPMPDYVGNVISWDRKLVLDACARIETVTGLPWHVAYTRGRLVGEQLVYGLYVDKVIGHDAARVWIDERSWCHTYWGPGPLPQGRIEEFVAAMRDDDVAFSIAGYTDTDRVVTTRAIELVLQRAAC